MNDSVPNEELPIPSSGEEPCDPGPLPPADVDPSLTVAALGRGSLMVLIAQGLQSIRGIVLLPFITRLLSAGDYGLWVQAGTLVSLLSPIATLYLGSAILRFFAGESDPKRVAGALHGVVVTIVTLGIAVTALALLAGPALASAFFEGQSALVAIALASLLPECLASVCLAYFRTFRQMGRFSFFSVARPYVELVTLIILLLTGHPLLHLVIAMAVVRGALSGIMAAIILRETGWASPDFQRLPEFLHFSVPLLPMNLMLWVTNASDRFVIGYYLGAAAVGYYNPGYALGSMVAVLSTPVMYVLPQFIYAHYDMGHPERAMRYLSHAMLLVITTGLLMAAVLGGLSLPILSLLATSEMAQRGYLVTPLVALGVTTQVGTAILSSALECVKKTHLMAYSALAGASLNLGLNLVFIPRYGIVAAAVTTLFAMVVDLSIRFRLAQRHVHLTIQWWRLARAAVAAGVLGSALFALSPVGVVPLLALGLVSPIIYLALLLGLRVVSRSDLVQGGKLMRKVIR